MPNGAGIKQINEKEYIAGGNHIFLIQNNIILSNPVGPQTIEMAKLYYQVTQKLLKLVNGQINILIDLNNSGKSSSEVRSFWNKVGTQKEYNKIAFFGLHPVARVIASFEIGINGSKNMQFFKTEEQAIEWLQK